MHVPEENLPLYRALRRIADQYDALGNSLSNIGEYSKANRIWSQGNEFTVRARELRVRPGNWEIPTQSMNVPN